MMPATKLTPATPQTRGEMPADIDLLVARGLRVKFETQLGSVTAVDGVSFELSRGKTLCIVGESGSGKSVTAMSLVRLLPVGVTTTVAGEVRLGGRNLLEMSEQELRTIRGRSISIVFQDPMGALNPLLTIGRQVSEPLRLHLDLSRAEAWRRAEELLDLVGIPSAHESLNSYPHQLSGGQRQRVVIAMALACNPEILIADEPTTALDVTTQAQILRLLRDLQQKLDMAIILITHDLGVVAEFADDVLVMYAGRVVEKARAGDLFRRPSHPYTHALLASIPPFEGEGTENLPAIPGKVPSPLDMPPGCAFHPRCQFGTEACTRAVPELADRGASHFSACLRAGELAGVA